MKLKELLPILCTCGTTIVDKKRNSLTNDLSYKEVLPFLDFEVIEIITDGYETIKVILDTNKGEII